MREISASRINYETARFARLLDIVDSDLSTDERLWLYAKLRNRLELRELQLLRSD